MTLLLDLGNSRLKWGLARAGAVREHGALDLGDEAFDARLSGLLARLQPAQALLASVAPAPVRARVEAALSQAGCALEVVAVQRHRPGLRIGYAEPTQFGVDRWLALVGAIASGPAPVLLVSSGTAVTVDLVDGGGAHRGGWIAPGPALMAQALRQRAAHLPTAVEAAPGFAQDSATAIGAGCRAATVGLVMQALQQARDVLGVAPRLVLAGGDGPVLAARLPVAAEVRAVLVLEGLAVLACERGPGAAATGTPR